MLKEDVQSEEVAKFNPFTPFCGQSKGANWETTLKHINPLNAKLNPICHLLALLGADPILHVSRIRVNFQLYSPTLQLEHYLLLLMNYIC